MNKLILVIAIIIFIPSVFALKINEILYDTPGTDSDEEWIELYNNNDFDVDISGYKIGDEEEKGQSEGMYGFPQGTIIKKKSSIVIAQKAEIFNEMYGFYPSFELEETAADIENMIKYSSWSSGKISLTNTGDEVILLDGNDEMIDIVTYGTSSFNNLSAAKDVSEGHSITREPDGYDTNNNLNNFIDRSDPNPKNDMISMPKYLDATFAIKLEISLAENQNITDNLIIGFMDNATEDYDNDFDIPKVPKQIAGDYVRLYSVDLPIGELGDEYQENYHTQKKYFDIQAYQESREAHEFTFSWKNFYKNMTYDSVALYDISKDQSIDMITNNNYTFILEPQEKYAFKVLFQKSSASMTFSKKGLYLVSFPIDLYDPDPLNNFDSDFELQKWDPKAKSYQYYYEGIDCSIDDCIESIEPGQGYWLLTKKDNKTLALEGDEVFDLNLDISSGWNQIGQPYMCEKYSFDNILFDDKDIFNAEKTNTIKSILYGYEENKNKYLMYQKESSLSKDRGYWIAALKDARINFGYC